MIPLIGLALQAAPYIAQWLGGTAAAEVTKQVTDTATQVFGTSDPAAIEKKIAEDKALYVQWQVKLGELHSAQDQRVHDERMAEFQDTINARLNYKDSKSITDSLAKVTVLAFFFLNAVAAYGMFLLLTTGVKISGNVEIWLTVAGMFGTLLGFVNSKTELVYSFFFGSSRGSDNKSADIGNALNKLVKGATK